PSGANGYTRTKSSLRQSVRLELAEQVVPGTNRNQVAVDQRQPTLGAPAQKLLLGQAIEPGLVDHLETGKCQVLTIVQGDVGLVFDQQICLGQCAGKLKRVGMLALVLLAELQGMARKLA